MALRFYNTLTQQVEPFVPLEGNTVRMYTCGPTVYSYVHIGNLRTFTFQDLLRRWLKARGFALQHVMNITDVDDKIIKRATDGQVSIREYTKQFEEAFIEDMKTLRLEGPERLVRATDCIPDMVAFIEGLAARGFTYETEGSTYFRIEKFPEYGKLSHQDFSGIRAGARVDVDEYDKDNARDFVLWKTRKDGEPGWDTVLGAGRPGWHIECSAMAMKYLGESLDIHAGGVDLTFPHHENEIAQSEALTGKPFARYWLHSEHLVVDWTKMSKSLGNIYTLRDIVEMGYAPEVLRYLLLSVPYRKKLNFTFDGLKGAATSVERLRNYKLRLDTAVFEAGGNEELVERTRQAHEQFDASLDDDLNTAEALAAVFEYVRDTNTAMDSGAFRQGNAGPAIDFLTRFDSIFDVLNATVAAGALADGDVDELIAERATAKKSRDFARADEIRNRLLDGGVILEDTKDGVRWKRK